MEYRVQARNTAVDSENRIHRDDTARQYGFRGGLVPGVDVYAYLTHAPVIAWGLDWLTHGTIAARFLQPVYDGDRVQIVARPDEPDRELELELLDSAGDLCASADAARPLEPIAPPTVDDVAEAPLPHTRPAASAATLAVGTVLGSLDVGFQADRAEEYLHDIGEEAPVFRTERIAHPGWLLRMANTVLAANVELGPWIHVSSETTHFGLVHDGQRVQTRAVVLDEYERKGHRFVELDVVMLADGKDPVVRVRHTAIYEPRRRVA